MATNPKVDGLTSIGAVRKPVIVKPEHIKRGILILLALAAFLTIAAVIKGINQSQSFKDKQEQTRTNRRLDQDKAAAANAKSPNRASTFQQDVATYQKNPTTVETTSTTTATSTNAALDDKGVPGMADAVNQERLRAYRDIHAPLAIAVPDGSKPVGSTNGGSGTSSVRPGTAPPSRPDTTAAAPQAEPVDPETQALLQRRAQLVEQLHLLEAQNGTKTR